MYGKDFERELEGYEARFPEESRRGALLLALHAVQREAGHVTDAAKAWLAERYGISIADVHGVVSFYTMYHDNAPGKHVIWLCRTFPCQMKGSREVARAFEEQLGCRVGETDATGTFALRWMECLAACDRAPCALIDDDMYLDLTPEAAGIVLDHVRNGGGGGEIQPEDGGPRLVPAPLSARLPVEGER